MNPKFTVATQHLHKKASDSAGHPYCWALSKNQNNKGSNLDPVNEGRKEKHKELHSGHVFVVEFGTGILILFSGAAIAVCETLVPYRLKVGTTAATAAPRPAVSQARLLVTLLRRFQKHPM